MRSLCDIAVTLGVTLIMGLAIITASVCTFFVFTHIGKELHAIEQWVKDSCNKSVFF